MSKRTGLLTPREIEVLKLKAIGKSTQEVSDTLYLSKRTVDSYLASIYSKLNKHNAISAIEEAKRLGILNLSLTTAENGCD